MGSGCAGCYNHPVEVVLLNALLDRFKAVGGACVHNVLGVLNIFQVVSEFSNILHIHNSGDIDTAMTHKYSDSGALSDDILLRRSIFTDRNVMSFKIQ